MYSNCFLHMRFSLPFKSWNGKGENILVWPGNGRTSIPWMHFETLYIINIYRHLQIPQVFPRGSCYESAKAIQSPHPGLKIIEQSWQIPRHARLCPPGTLPPGMVADKCIIIMTTKIPVWVLPYICLTSIDPTSSPGRFSLAFPRPQSQGKAPWGRGWYWSA